MKSRKEFTEHGDDRDYFAWIEQIDNLVDWAAEVLEVPEYFTDPYYKDFGQALQQRLLLWDQHLLSHHRKMLDILHLPRLSSISIQKFHQL